MSVVAWEGVVDEAQCGALPWVGEEGSRRNSLRLLHPPSSRQREHLLATVQ